MSLSIEQMQANADAKYHLDRLIAFAQCDKLSATDQQIKECLLSIFNHNVTGIVTSYTQRINNAGIVHQKALSYISQEQKLLRETLVADIKTLTEERYNKLLELDRLTTDNPCLHSVRIENKRNWFGGYTTEIEVV